MSLSAAADSETLDPADERPCQSRSVMVVEDDYHLRTLLGELLSEVGYQVTAAADGREGLQQLQALPSDSLPFVILLDLMMPVMDGWEFRRLQLEDPRLASIPVVVTTAALGNPGPQVAALRAEGCLTKPFRMADLTETVSRFCCRPTD